MAKEKSGREKNTIAKKIMGEKKRLKKQST
jgi:hypothetical protein